MAIINYYTRSGGGTMEIIPEEFLPCDNTRLRKLEKVVTACVSHQQVDDLIRAMQAGAKAKKAELYMERQALIEQVRDCKISPSKAERWRRSIEHRMKQIERNEEEIRGWDERLII